MQARILVLIYFLTSCSVKPNLIKEDISSDNFKAINAVLSYHKNHGLARKYPILVDSVLKIDTTSCNFKTCNTTYYYTFEEPEAYPVFGEIKKENRYNYKGISKLLAKAFVLPLDSTKYDCPVKIITSKDFVNRLGKTNLYPIEAYHFSPLLPFEGKNK